MIRWRRRQAQADDIVEAVTEASQRGRSELLACARALHQRAILVDLHVDCIIQQRLFGYDVSARHAFDSPPRWGSLKFDLLRKGVQRWAGGRRPLFYHADVPRMVEAGYSLVGFGLHYWPWQSERGWDEIQRQLDYFDELVDSDPRLCRASEPADVRAAVANGKLAAFAGLEGVHGLGAGGSARADELRLRRLETLWREGPSARGFGFPRTFPPPEETGRLRQPPEDG